MAQQKTKGTGWEESKIKKQWLLYGLLFVAAVLAPVEGTDVGKLHPVQAVSIGYYNEQVILKTDTGEIGRGENPELALKNLKQTAPAVIYLDTAEYLLIEDNALELVTQIEEILKSNVRICQIEPQIEVDKAAKYLRVHGELPKLKQWNTGENLPVLTMENERIILS